MHWQHWVGDRKDIQPVKNPVSAVPKHWNFGHSTDHWCGLTPLVLGQDQPETKKISLCLASCSLGLGLAGLVLFCETRSCNIRHHNDLEQHSNSSSTIYSFSILCLVLGSSLLCRSAVAFTYLKVKSVKCLCLLTVVLVLLFWSWSGS